MVDAFTREALAIDVDQDIKGEQVFEAVTRIVLSHGALRTIRIDNEPELILKALDRWPTRTASHSTSAARASRTLVEYAAAAAKITAE